jgi:hypothetical protein
MIFSPSLYNKYGGNAFPALIDAVLDFQASNRSSSSSSTMATKKTIENIKIELAILTHTIQAVVSILKDPLDFSRYTATATATATSTATYTKTEFKN